MQIASGERKALTITREEFEDVMAEVHKKVLKMISDKGQSWQPLYSWDHTALHENVDYSRMGFSKQQRVALGVRAPDMHKVIEHVFGYIKPRMHARLYQADYKVTALECQRLAKRVFMEAALAEKIKKDVASLPLTYKVINTKKGESFVVGKKVHFGTGGDWPPSTYR
jgi:arylamine N-acetyltransferase